VREQADAFGAKVILIEDRASGTQLLQELVHEGVYAAQSYKRLPGTPLKVSDSRPS